MEKEIELILSKLKIVIEEKEQGMYLSDKEHSKLLLDYITNLQQENERLKELCDKYEEEHSNEFQCWKGDRKELLDKRARIEKAVEYIEEQYKWIEESDKRWQPVLDNKKILNILNGKE